MANPQMEFGEVHMAYTNAETHAGRAEHISRLTLAHVGRLVTLRLGRPRADVRVERLRVPPIHVSFDTMDDEMIARTSAEEIYRALLGAL
jgi:hypothetical protein